MEGNHIHRYLRCANGCTIPVPHPKLEETLRSLDSLSTEVRTTIVVCPECGLGSVYSERDMIAMVVAGKANLFEEKQCSLISVQIGCADKDCRLRTAIHTVQGFGMGGWKAKVVPKDWHFVDSIRCPRGHKLLFDEARSAQFADHVETPF